MRMARTVGASILAVVVASSASAGVVSYQGRVEVSGSPYTGNGFFKFALVNQAGDTTYWSHNGSSVGGAAPTTWIQLTVSGGLFEVLLGDTAVPGMTQALDANAFVGSPGDRYLRVWFGTDTSSFVQLAPDHRVTAVPMALASIFNGDGSQLTNLTATNIVGTVNDANLSANVALLNRDPQSFTGANAFQKQVTAWGHNGVSSPFRVRTDYLDTYGAVAPTDVFRIDNTSAFYAKGTLGIGVIPVSGAGEKLFWHPFKAAFRAGSIGSAGTQWDDPNVGFYTWAGGYNTTALGLSSFAMGYLSTAEGSYSVALGYTAHAGGTGAVGVGYRAIAGHDYSVAIGHRAATFSSCQGQTNCDPATATGGHPGAIVIADGSTTAHLAASANNQFSVRAAGGYRLFTNATMTVGVQVSAGGNSWSVISDRDVKEEFEPLDGEQVLEKLQAVPVTSWRLKTEEDRTVRHIGPMAQDWHAAFALSGDDRRINMSDIDGVNLVAVKALAQRTRSLAERNAALEKENLRLREETRALESRLEKIEEALGVSR